MVTALQMIQPLYSLTITWDVFELLVVREFQRMKESLTITWDVFELLNANGPRPGRLV